MAKTTQLAQLLGVNEKAARAYAEQVQAFCGHAVPFAVMIRLMKEHQGPCPSPEQLAEHIKRSPWWLVNRTGALETLEPAEHRAISELAGRLRVPEKHALQLCLCVQQRAGDNPPSIQTIAELCCKHPGQVRGVSGALEVVLRALNPDLAASLSEPRLSIRGRVGLLRTSEPENNWKSGRAWWESGDWETD